MRLAPPVATAGDTGGRVNMRVGSVTLYRCLSGDYFCGSVAVLLDPARQVPGRLDLAIAWLPHSDRSLRSQGTIVAVEGGPGYPSIGSRTLYRQLYAPLLTTRDLLLVDNRGTGRSSAIVCEPLQRAPLMKLSQVTRCGEQLGHTSDLYGTAIAADDLATVISALRIKKIDIYGDSYGSFFAQAFAGRHPKLVRSVTLDGAYQVIGGSPWYPTTSPTLRRAFELVCERSPVCTPPRGSSFDRIERLLAKLRKGLAQATPSDLAFVMDTAGLDPLVFRDLDAAARAYVEGNDRIPFARLVDEAFAEEEGAGGGARSYSQGLFAAASCSDNPQAYDMRLKPPQRVRQWREVLDRKRVLDPRLYSPFTLDEFLNIPIDYAYVPLCQTWPLASKLHPPGEPVPPGTRFPNVPVLVLNGDLDTITTPAEGEKAAELFANATHVIVANTGHVTALDDFNGCAARIVRNFTQTGRVDAHCAAEVPALHLVPNFARRLTEVEPATALPENQAPRHELQAAATAILAAADVLSRSYTFSLRTGSGLRGGSYIATIGSVLDDARLTDVRWTEDLAVSGNAQLDARDSAALANLTLSGASHGTLHATWTTVGRSATATLDGLIDGYRLRARMPAP